MKNVFPSQMRSFLFNNNKDEEVVVVHDGANQEEYQRLKNSVVKIKMMVCRTSVQYKLPYTEVLKRAVDKHKDEAGGVLNAPLVQEQLQQLQPVQMQDSKKIPVAIVLPQQPDEAVKQRLSPNSGSAKPSSTATVAGMQPPQSKVIRLAVNPSKSAGGGPVPVILSQNNTKVNTQTQCQLDLYPLILKGASRVGLVNPSLERGLVAAVSGPAASEAIGRITESGVVAGEHHSVAADDHHVVFLVVDARRIDGRLQLAAGDVGRQEVVRTVQNSAAHDAGRQCDQGSGGGQAEKAA